MNWIIIIGFTAAILTTISFVPQIIKILKTKGTKDISLLMYVVLATGFLLWLVYSLLLKQPPIIFANIIAFTLAFIVLVLKIKHG